MGLERVRAIGAGSLAAFAIQVCPKYVSQRCEVSGDISITQRDVQNLAGWLKQNVQ